MVLDLTLPDMSVIEANVLAGNKAAGEERVVAIHERLRFLSELERRRESLLQLAESRGRLDEWMKQSPERERVAKSSPGWRKISSLSSGFHNNSGPNTLTVRGCARP